MQIYPSTHNLKLIIALFITCSAVVIPTSKHAIADSKGIGVVIKDLSGRQIDLYSGSYALVIGVGQYTAGWPNLESVPTEIKRVENALQQQGFETTMVLNPNGDSLRKQFQAFINAHGFNHDNRLLFFFSGHGHSRLNGTKGYLVPADAPDPRQDDLGFLRTAVGMSQVIEWSRRIEAKHALFIFDSCFSGTVFKTRALPDIPPHISRLTARPVRQFISAGSAGEAVPAKSVFTPSLIRALAGEGDINRDNYITGTELGMYLHQKVLSYKSGQTPQYGKIRDPELDEGDIVFALKREAGNVTNRQNITPLATADSGPDIPSVSLKKNKTRLEANKPQGVESSPENKISSTSPQKNSSKQYVKYENGIVYDSQTGLEWIIGPDRDTSFTTAKDWVEKLSTNGGGWRLPTRSELRSLYHKEGWFSVSMPAWVEFPDSGIWSNHVQPQMTGNSKYYFYQDGVEQNTSFAETFTNMRSLSVRQKGNGKINP